MIDRSGFARQGDLHVVAAVEARIARMANMEVGVLHLEERPQVSARAPQGEVDGEGCIAGGGIAA